MQPFQVECQTHQTPFTRCCCQATQQELAEPQDFLLAGKDPRQQRRISLLDTANILSLPTIAHGSTAKRAHLKLGGGPQKATHPTPTMMKGK